MKIQFIHSALAAIVTVRCLAIPTPQDAPLWTKPVGVYYCTDANWLGICKWHEMTKFVNEGAAAIGECQVLPDPFASSISAIGPDPGIFCLAFSNDFCNLDEIDVPRPEEKDPFPLALQYDGDGVLSPSWNDKIKSFYCVDEKFSHGLL